MLGYYPCVQMDRLRSHVKDSTMSTNCPTSEHAGNWIQFMGVRNSDYDLQPIRQVPFHLVAARYVNVELLYLAHYVDENAKNFEYVSVCFPDVQVAVRHPSKNLMMAVMESVAIRQRGGIDFAAHYDNLCALHNTCPIPAVKAHLSQRVLDINADRIRTTDWLPILNTLKINKTLEFIAVRSYFQQRVDDAEERGYAIKRKIPSIRSKEITYRLCRALKDCMCVNQSVTSIELQGVPLRERDVSALAKGIGNSGSLKHLSVEYSIIGDELVDILCRVIKNAVSVTSLNFSGCGLSWKSAEVLSELIKHQAMLRHNEAWKDSLRYRRPDLDRMSGLRRITLNSNPMICDQGAQLLADVLKDDLWVKALDLQKCGITNVGAKAILEILKYNTTLVVVDLRQNPLIDGDTMKNIMDQVVINTGGQPSEYQWIKAEVPEDPATLKQRKKRSKTLLNNFGRKMTVKVSGTPQRKRPSSDPASAGRSAVRPSPGIPWRAAMRATRCRGYPPDSGTSLVSVLESTASEQSVLSPGQHHSVLDGRRSSHFGDNVDSSQSELEQLRRHINAESAARMAAENRASQMALENIRLRKELEDLQAQRSLLDDDSIINQIEQSFEQFNKFLDLLRDVGLGQLISMAGLDKPSMSLVGRQADPGNHPLSNSQSRHNTTLQMRSFLEQSCLDDSAIMSDIRASGHSSQQPTAAAFGSSHLRENFNHANRSTDPTSTVSHDKSSSRDTKRGSKFDELYRKALEDTENILAATLPSSGSAVGGRHSGVQSEKSSRSESERVVSMNVANSDRSRVVSGKSDPSSGRPQAQPRTLHTDLNRSTDSERSKVSLRSGDSDRMLNRSDLRSVEKNGSRRVNESDRSNDYIENDSVDERSDEYTTDNDEVEELDLGTSPR